jgi:putative hemolysin
LDPDSSSLIVLLILIASHAFFAAAETAITSVRKSHLKSLADEGSRAALLLSRLSEDTTRLVASSQLGLKLAGFLAAAISASSLSPILIDGLKRLEWLGSINVSPNLAMVPITLALVIVILVFGQLLPKHLAKQQADMLALWVAYPLRAWQIAASPLVWLVVKLTEAFTRGPSDGLDRMGLPFVTEEEIKTLVDAGEEGGVIEEDEKDMIYSIFEFGDTLAREVMVPRVDVVAVNAESSMLEALDIILEAGHSRVPVYEESIDRIVGLLYAKDLLRKLRDGENDLPLEMLLREVYYVPETKPLNDLLQELQKLKVHMAIAIDEYGGTAGLVTIEDILEEIVGEIQDEYDAEEALMERITEDEVIFNARTDLDDLNRVMDIDLPTEDNDTLGGLIYSELGYVPDVGAQVHIDGVRVTVLSVEGHRIDRVKVERLADQGQAEPTQNQLKLNNVPSLTPGAQSRPS